MLIANFQIENKGGANVRVTFSPLEIWTGSTQAKATTNVKYDYDTQGRLVSVIAKELNGTTLSTPLVTKYTYDNVGNLLSETDPNGVTTTYTHDDLNRLLSETEKNVSNTTFYSETFSLNPDGTRASSSETQVQANSSTDTISTTWTYDAMSRLTSETVTNSDGSQSFADTISYDLDGNRVGMSHVAGGTTDSTTYSYNGDGELTSQTDSTSGTTTYGYDANGSETGESGGVSATYVYDDRNRLVSATVNGTTQTYTYDDNGDRVSMTTGGATTLYEVDDQSTTGYPQVAAEINASTSALVVGYAWGEQLIAQDRGGTSSLYLYDGHGSVRALASVTAAVTDTYTYNAFGVLTANTGSTTNPYQFAMMRSDGATGMYYDNARYYIAPLDRFNQRDSYVGNNSDPVTLHKYLYANANPANTVDPSGHDGYADLLVTMGIIARIGTGIGFGVVGAWNLANGGLDVYRAYQASISDSPTARLEIVGWMALAALQTYTGLVNIQTANALLFGAPIPPIPPTGLTVLRAAFAAAGEDPVQIAEVVIAMDPAIAGVFINAAGAFLAASSLIHEINAPNGGVTNYEHGGPAHDAAINDYVNNRIPKGAENIRKNLSQVDFNGNSVGRNRPDIQYDYNGIHYVVEIDNDPTASSEHAVEILQNDPNAHLTQIVLGK